MQRKDVYMLSYRPVCGKSMIFQLVPKICFYPHNITDFTTQRTCTVVVLICPLNSLIEWRIQELADHGIAACSRGDDGFLEGDILKHSLVFTSPELIICEERCRNMFTKQGRSRKYFGFQATDETQCSEMVSRGSVLICPFLFVCLFCDYYFVNEKLTSWSVNLRLMFINKFNQFGSLPHVQTLTAINQKWKQTDAIPLHRHLKPVCKLHVCVTKSCFGRRGSLCARQISVSSGTKDSGDWLVLCVYSLFECVITGKPIPLMVPETFTMHRRMICKLADALSNGQTLIFKGHFSHFGPLVKTITWAINCLGVLKRWLAKDFEQLKYIRNLHWKIEDVSLFNLIIFNYFIFWFNQEGYWLEYFSIY